MASIVCNQFSPHVLMDFTVYPRWFMSFCHIIYYLFAVAEYSGFYVVLCLTCFICKLDGSVESVPLSLLWVVGLRVIIELSLGLFVSFIYYYAAKTSSVCGFVMFPCFTDPCTNILLSFDFTIILSV